MDQYAVMSIDTDKEMEEMIRDRFDLAVELERAHRLPIYGGEKTRITMTLPNTEHTMYLFSCIMKMLAEQQNKNHGR